MHNPQHPSFSCFFSNLLWINASLTILIFNLSFPSSNYFLFYSFSSIFNISSSNYFLFFSFPCSFFNISFLSFISFILLSLSFSCSSSSSNENISVRPNYSFYKSENPIRILSISTTIYKAIKSYT